MLRAELEYAAGALAVGLSLEVAPGSCLALAGPSGAGKTTVLRLLAGTLRPRRGRVSCDGEVWLDTAARQWLGPERRRCGLVFQDYALFPHLSAWRNVAYGLRDVPRGERRARAGALLERFGLGERADARPAHLSGGERQRVALARALAARPRALLLDEPLSALDARTRASATRELASILRELEVPVVLVTHSFDEAALLGDEVAVIEDGRVVQRASAGALAAAPASAFVADFSGAVVLTGLALESEPGAPTRIRLDGGGEVASTDPARGRVALSVHPWEVALAPAGSHPRDSTQNRLAARVRSLTVLGPRVRVGLDAGQPLVAEVTATAVDELGLRVGSEVLASWKATATRVLAEG